MPSRSIARLTAWRTRRSCHGDFGSHCSGKYSQFGAWQHDRLQREARRLLQLLGKLAADRIGDVDLALLERREPRRLVGHHLHHQPLDGRRFAPVAVEGFEHEFDAWLERNEFVGAGADRRLLEALVADLLDVFLGHDPAGSRGARVKGQEVRPRLLESEDDVLWIGSFDLRDLAFHQVVRRALVALEREFDVLGGHRIAVVKLGVLADDEGIADPVLGGGPRLGEARRLQLPRHRLHHRIVQCVEHHERGDETERLGRIEPGWRQRDVDAPGQLPVRGRGDRHAGRTRQSEGRHPQQIAPRQLKIAIALGVGSLRLWGPHVSSLFTSGSPVGAS